MNHQQSTRLLFVFALLAACSVQLPAQNNVGIGTSNPAPSAILDLTSSGSGLLIPRMNTAGRLAISNPERGLLVYDSTIRNFYYYETGGWMPAGSGSSELEKINGPGTIGHRIRGRNPAFFGNIGNDAIDLSFSTDGIIPRGAIGANSFAAGYNTIASGSMSTTFGAQSTASEYCSVAAGFQTNASGPYAVSMGSYSAATGNSALAMGASTIASGSHSTALGYQTVAAGQDAVAMGQQTMAAGFIATAMGFQSNAAGSVSTAMGQQTFAGGTASTAMGYGTAASGVYSTATGRANIAAGSAAFAAGDSVWAPAFAEAAVGTQNTRYNPAGVNNFNKADRAFTVGIGNGIDGDTDEKNDGLIVYKDGTIELDSLRELPAVTANRLYVYNNKLYFSGTATGGGELEKITANGHTGYRIRGRDTALYGHPGQNSVDLSSSDVTGSNHGATGRWAFATGNNNTAAGASSAAFGDSTYASGTSAATFGLFTAAPSCGEMAVGSFNTNYTAVSNSIPVPADRAFVVGIGNGITGNPNQYNDGLIVYKDGTLELDKLAASPAVTNSRLYILNNKLYYNGAPVSDGPSQLERISEGGTTGYRLFGRNPFFYGYTGQDAIDLSYQTQVSSLSGSIGDYSVCMGYNTSAWGLNSTAFGNQTNAAGYAAMASGVRSEARGDVSAAMGYENIAYAARSLVAGQFNNSIGLASAAFGSHTEAEGDYSFTAGDNSKAPSFSEFVVGTHNTNYTAVSNIVFNNADRAFVVGIGSSVSNQNDGFIVYKNGTTELDVLTAAPAVTSNRLYNIGNTLYINGTVVGTQTSDARYKESIENMPSVLTGIRQLRPVSFHWKNNKWGAQKEIGFLAQELKNFFPEVVSTDADGYYKVNYGLLTAVLTRGMQEQQDEIDQLHKRNAALDRTVNDLLKRLEKLEKAVNGGN